MKLSLLKLPADYPRKQWFNSAPLFVLFPVLIVIYAFTGFYFQYINGVLAGYLTPLVNGLGFIGINVAPVLTGPLDTTLYKNLSGISIMGALTYNLVTLLYVLKNKSTPGLSCVDAHALMMKRKQWSAKRAWIILHLNLYIGVGALMAFGTVGLLNGTFHWVVFSSDHGDVLKVCAVSVYFFFLGSLPVYFYSVYLKYIAFDVAYLFKKYKKNSQGSE